MKKIFKTIREFESAVDGIGTDVTEVFGHILNEYDQPISQYKLTRLSDEPFVDLDYVDPMTFEIAPTLCHSFKNRMVRLSDGRKTEIIVNVPVSSLMTEWAQERRNEILLKINRLATQIDEVSSHGDDKWIVVADHKVNKTTFIDKTEEHQKYKALDAYREAMKIV